LAFLVLVTAMIPLLPPLMLRLNFDTGASGTVLNVLTSLPSLVVSLSPQVDCDLTPEGHDDHRQRADLVAGLLVDADVLDE
jgi:hypothetical protein